MNLSMFIIGSAVFIVAFSFFKVTALQKTKNQNESWLKLISVLPAHYYFLTQVGIHTIENLKLDLLAKDSVDLSFVMILPLKTKGSAASPIRPVAIGSSRS